MLLPPVVGGFQGCVGLFEGDDLFEGHPLRVRFEWSQMHNGASRWQQAFSAGDDATWKVNWVMEFAQPVQRARGYQCASGITCARQSTNTYPGG